MKYAVPAMRQRGAGSIINISSIYGLVGSGFGAAYHGTKGAVRILTKTAAVQYASEKIRVNSTPSTDSIVVSIAHIASASAFRMYLSQIFAPRFRTYHAPQRPSDS
jgi:NAD(P)-dependent dehydrogenase (short-subunit alcohol dehydrogenase family)